MRDFIGMDEFLAYKNEVCRSDDSEEESEEE